MHRTDDIDPRRASTPSSADRERHARTLLLGEQAAPFAPRPWQHRHAPPSATDLTRYAVWRGPELSAEQLLAALTLLPAARAEIESVEVGLLFSARSEGLTWAQIAEAMGFRSPQACQQYVARLSARQEAAE